MTQDDIIRMAKEAGFNPVDYMGSNFDLFQRFFHLAQAAEADRIANESKHIIKRAEQRGAALEREECAKLCEAYVAPGIGKEMATAIRARGSK